MVTRCRIVICIIVCFMKTKCKGEIVVSSRKRCGIIREFLICMVCGFNVENKEKWRGFIEMLFIDDLGLLAGEEIKEAAKELCLWLSKDNVQDPFANSEISSQVAAYNHTLRNNWHRVSGPTNSIPKNHCPTSKENAWKATTKKKMDVSEGDGNRTRVIERVQIDP
ncbi:hypothetical protein Tco_1575679 [Tanacetum coccineum]